MKKSVSNVVRSVLKRRGSWLGALTVATIGALGCAMTPASAYAANIKTSVHMEYRASGFYVQSDAFKGADAAAGYSKYSDNGIANYLRLNANFKDMDSGISIHTSINLLGDRWRGDRQYPGVVNDGFTPAGNYGNALYINYAYLQVPIGGTLFRIGRQKASYANCFLVCDDNRDRILWLAPFGGHYTFIAGYDRRQDGFDGGANTALPANQTGSFNNLDNGDQLFFAVLGPIPATQFNFGFLWVHWLTNYRGLISGPAGSTNANVYALAHVNDISPFIDGHVGPINIQAAVNWFANGTVSVPNAPGQIFRHNGLAEYVRAGGDIGMFKLRAQWIGTQNGGIMSPGFDTFSSLINNSPESTENPTSVYDMGQTSTGAGARGWRQHLTIVNAIAQITPKFSIGGSVGRLHVTQPSYVGGTSGGNMVYDLKATYQVNKALKLWATAGYMSSNPAVTLNGNSLINPLPSTHTLDGHGVGAASMNMLVKF